MKLLTAAIRAKLPPLRAQGSKRGNMIAYVKFFAPDSNWTWYVTEGGWVREKGLIEDDASFVFFGLVVGLETELGYFSLSDLVSIRGKLGLPIERDLYFKPIPLKDLPECPEWLR